MPDTSPINAVHSGYPRRGAALEVARLRRAQDILDRLGHGLVIEQGTELVDGNEGFLVLLGLSEMPAQLDPFVTEDGLEALAFIRERLEDGSPQVKLRVSLHHVDGRTVWVDLLAAPTVWNEDPAFQFVMLDVSELVRHEQELAYERTILEEHASSMAALGEEVQRAGREAERARVLLHSAADVSPDGFAIFDGDDRLLLCNRAFSQPLGQTPATALGQSFEALFRHGHAVPADAEEEALEAIVRAHLDRHRTADGTPVEFQLGETWLILRDKRMTDGSTVVFLTDVTRLKQVEADLRALAATDPLTGLLNRRAFLDAAETALAGCYRHGQPATVVMMDLDHFKAVNDRFGHAGGDDALRQGSAVCRDVFRKMDLVARWGGEEFIALLPSVDLAGTLAAAERLRARIENHRIRSAEHDFSVTVSIGVAAVAIGETAGTVSVDALERAVGAADICLYRSKAAGRNRITATSDHATVTAS